MKKQKWKLKKIGRKEKIIILIALVLISVLCIVKPFSKAEQINTSGKIKIITDALSISESEVSTATRVYVGTPVDQGGEGTVSGTRENPVETLQEAYNILPSQGGMIVLLENKSIDAWPSLNASKPVVVMGDTGAEVIDLTGNTLQFTGNVSFLDLTINASYAAGTNAYFYCNGNSVTFGSEGENNFKITRDDNEIYYPTIFGAGENGTTVQSTNVKIYSGNYSQVFSGGNITANVAGDANLLIDGGNSESSNITFELQSTELSNYFINSGNAPFGKTATTGGVQNNNTIIKNANVGNTYSVSGANGNIRGNANLTIENSTINRIDSVSNFSTIGGNLSVTINNVTSGTGFYDFSYNTSDGVNYTGNDTLEYNLNITNSSFAVVSLETGRLSTNNANITITDSTISNSFKNIAGNRNNQNVQFNNVTLNDTLAMNPSAGTNQLTIQNMGTEEAPIAVQLSNTDNAVNLVAQNAKVELKNTMLMNDCTFSNAYITLTDETVLNVNGTYTGDAESTICITPSSTIHFNGTVKGTTGVDINQSESYGSIQAVLANCENGEDSFVVTNHTQKFPDEILNIENTKVTTYITWRVYYDYEFSDTNTVIYVDGDNGQDDYEDETASSQIGSTEYPVKSLDRAYSLLSDKCNTIVLVGNVYVGDTETSTLVELPELPNRITNKEEYTVTITTTDGINDFYSRANLYFLSSGTTERHYQFNSNVTLENVKLINSTSATATSVPKGNRYIYAGGYKLIIGEGVQTDLQTTIDSNSRGRRRFLLFAGAYGKQVEESYLEINSGHWHEVNMNGNDGSIVGDSTRTEYAIDEEPVVTLKIYGGAVTAINATVTNSNATNTTIYGNVKIEVGSKDADGTVYPTIHNSGGRKSMDLCFW